MRRVGGFSRGDFSGRHSAANGSPCVPYGFGALLRRRNTRRLRRDSRSALMPTMDNVAEDVRRSGHSRVWWLDRPHVLISRRVSQTADWDLSIFKVARSTTLASRPIVRSHLPPLHHRGV